jgi:hypothetical protein
VGARCRAGAGSMYVRGNALGFSAASAEHRMLGMTILVAS